MRSLLPAILAFALYLTHSPRLGSAEPNTASRSKTVAEAKVQREKLLSLDDDVRVRFDKAMPRMLPERKRKLPAATATSFDWVRVLGETPIHAQGDKPTCTAQAVVAAMEWNWQLRNGLRQKPALSPQPVLDRLQKTGALPINGSLDQLMLHGTAPLAQYPYVGVPHKPPAKVKTTYRLVGWGEVGRPGKMQTADLKKALLERGPLVTGVYVTNAFHRYKGGVFAEHANGIPKTDPTTHVVVIVGWDDKKGHGCWHLQNSWGLKWGEEGGMWIEYDCNNIGYYAYWLRAQSTQYNLPKDAHEVLGEDADPFPRWPSARTLAGK